MAYAQCPKCHARLRVPDSRQSLHVRCPGCSHAFRTRPGARQVAAPTSVRAGGRPLLKWVLAAWAVVAIGTAAGITYLLATDTGPTQAPVHAEATVPDETASSETTGESAAPLLGVRETEDPSGVVDGVIPPPPLDGIDETPYQKKPKPPKKPRKPGRKKGRGNRKSGANTSSDDELEKTDISAPPKKTRN